MELIVAIDTGSSCMRGILFSHEEGIVYTESIKYQMEIGCDGSATMNADTFRYALYDICRALSDFAQRELHEIIGISFTSQRSSVLAVDEHGQALYPIIMWYDKRSCCICDQMTAEYGSEMYSICGMRLTPVCSAPKIAWLRNACPEVYSKAYKLIGVHDYLLYLACGRFVTDASLASRTGLISIRSLDWSDRLLSLFDIKKDKLCEIVHPGTVVGTVSVSFSEHTGLSSGIPIVTAGGDQQCGVLGQGVSEAGIAAINSGSASYISVISRSLITDQNMQLNQSAFCLPDKWVIEASNMGSGTSYQWFNQSFYHNGLNKYDCSAIDAEVAAIPAGSGGLICINDFAGRGCPDFDPNARGMFLNIGMDMKRGHFARALLEGICFDIREAFDYLVSFAGKIDTVQSSGGLTKFSIFNQILTDVLGIPIAVCGQGESTGIGAALMALIALGRIKSTSDYFKKYNNYNNVIYKPDTDLVSLYGEIYSRRKSFRSAIQY